MRTSLSKCFRGALLLAALLIVFACGASTEESARPQAPTTSSEVADVSFLLVTDSRSSAREAQETAAMASVLLGTLLREAGYNVREDATEADSLRAKQRDMESRAESDSSESSHAAPSAAPEAVLLFTITVTKRSQAFKWVQNGKVMGGYDVRADLSVKFGERVVEQTVREFRVTLGEVDREELSPLVRELNASRRMHDFGAFMTGHRAQMIRELADQQRAEEAAAYEAWFSRYAKPCSEPATATACEGLADWLVDGRNASKEALMKEGRRIMTDAEPRLAQLRDDVAWLKATVSTCLDLATERDCARVKEYLVHFPAGSHHDDAVAAIANLDARALERGKKRVADAKREELEEQQRQQDATARAREEQEKRSRQNDSRQCRAGCGAKCASVLEQQAFKSCLAGCVAGCP